MDKAGTAYWDQQWDSVAGAPFRPHDKRTRYYGDRTLAALLERSLRPLPRGSLVLEAGCADSTILPYVASHLGYRISGLDYSPVGCERFRKRLAQFGVRGEVECCDLFTPPEGLLGNHDAVISFGLVEHFSDTTSVVKALAALVRPGGRIFTLVPNMQGAVGLAQWLVGPKIRKVHERLSPRDLAVAHQAAGLRVIEAEYLLPMGFGVVNFNEPAPHGVVLARRLAVAALARVSWFTWLLEERGFRLPRSALLSPYAYCVAEA